MVITFSVINDQIDIFKWFRPSQPSKQTKDKHPNVSSQPKLYFFDFQKGMFHFETNDLQ